MNLSRRAKRKTEAIRDFIKNDLIHIKKQDDIPL